MRGIWLILGALAFVGSSLPATVHVACEHSADEFDSGAPTCLVCAKLSGNPPADVSLPELGPSERIEFRQPARDRLEVVTCGVTSRGRAPPFGSSTV